MKQQFYLLFIPVVSLAIAATSMAEKAKTAKTAEKGNIKQTLISPALDHQHTFSTRTTSKRIGKIATGQPTASASPPDWPLSDIKQLDNSMVLAKQGDTYVNSGNWLQAKECYQKALAIWSDNTFALYGLGNYAASIGNTATAIDYYRKAVYSDNPYQSTDGIRENDAGRLMEYALLLSQAGQQKEALKIYRRGAEVLNYLDGKPNLVVPLPGFEPGEWANTPKHLQAMAHIGLAIDKAGFGNALVEKHLQQAVALSPDSPLPYFYRAEHEKKSPAGRKKAKADYALAQQFGNPDVAAGVKKAERISPNLR